MHGGEGGCEQRVVMGRLRGVLSGGEGGLVYVCVLRGTRLAPVTLRAWTRNRRIRYLELRGSLRGRVGPTTRQMARDGEGRHTIRGYLHCQQDALLRSDDSNVLIAALRKNNPGNLMPEVR